jgi:NADH-quinone oxidoreductase subunit E
MTKDNGEARSSASATNPWQSLVKREWSRIGAELANPLRDDMAATARLLASPTAPFIAMSAVGLGMAAHVVGLWTGVLAGMASVSQGSATGAPGPRNEARIVPMPKRWRPELKVVAAIDRPRSAPASSGSRTARQAAPKAKSAAQVPERPSPVERPALPDDLKAISGVGPKLEKVLNDLGIWTYAQIANWGPGEIAWLEDHLSLRGRIQRDDWVGQARALEKDRQA